MEEDVWLYQRKHNCRYKKSIFDMHTHKKYKSVKETENKQKWINWMNFVENEGFCPLFFNGLSAQKVCTRPRFIAWCLPAKIERIFSPFFQYDLRYKNLTFEDPLISKFR